MICQRIFKLPENYVKIFLEEKLVLVKHGGFTGEDVRKMPIYERKFHIEKLLELNHSKKDDEQM